jgi:hypothetical protein
MEPVAKREPVNLLHKMRRSAMNFFNGNPFIDFDEAHKLGA